MSEKKLYILTYEHGGYVLWKEHIRPRLEKIFEWMEKYPKLKIGLDYEAFTFDEFEKSEPETLDMIKRLIEKYPDRVGLGSTTYGQPLSLAISEESNARQLTYAVKTNMKFFSKTPPVYAISEFALNNQTPQLAALSGYEGALLRSHVMGYGYPKNFDSAYGKWIGRDKTAMPAVPTYIGQGRGFNCCTVDNWIFSRWPNESDLYSPDDFVKMFSKYEPLLASRYDDVCQDIEPVTEYVETKDNYSYVLLEDILKLYGEPTDELVTTDNDFHVQMPWGYCGNEIFNMGRKAETEAVRAEKLCALSVMLGGDSCEEFLEKSWKNALISQHHDITICGLLDLSRRFLPLSLSASEEASNKALSYIAAHFAGEDGKNTVGINLHSFPVDEWLEAKQGNIHVKLPAFSAKIIEDDRKKYKYSYNEESGILTTPVYSLKLTSYGIEYTDDVKSGRRIFDNKDEALFTALVENEPCSSCGAWRVDIHGNFAKALYSGDIGGIPFSLEMRFSGDSERIDCKTEFEMHGEHVGEAGECHGLNKSVTVDGMTHENKLNFNLRLCLGYDRKIYRDLPYSVSEWSGCVRDVEDYWYKSDKIIYDKEVTPKEAFNSSTYTSGIYWVALRDENYGVAVMNRGCMGAVIRGNLLSVPLLYSNLYMCGTRILEGTFSDEFALLPFGAELSNAQLHKKAVSYSYLPHILTAKGTDDAKKELSLAKLNSESGEVILTALYPENGEIFARFCNYSDDEGIADFSVFTGNAEIETDLLGNKISEITDGRLHFRPWEIKTVKFKLNAD